MKFDFAIGNPPYQEDRQGNSNTALPVYHQFMEAAYIVSNATELITPARFLFNAGRTPKDWNQKMLRDEHFKVMEYEADASTVCIIMHCMIGWKLLADIIRKWYRLMQQFMMRMRIIRGILHEDLYLTNSKIRVIAMIITGRYLI